MYTINNFINDVEKALYGFKLGDFKIYEEKDSCEYLAGSTKLKKVTYEWHGRAIASIILDIDQGTTIVRAKKKITDDFKIINPFFLKRYVRKCMKHEIDWIRGRNKIYDIFEKIHSPEPDAIIPLENKRIVLKGIIRMCFNNSEKSSSYLSDFLQDIANFIVGLFGLNYTVQIEVTDKDQRKERDV